MNNELVLYGCNSGTCMMDVAADRAAGSWGNPWSRSPDRSSAVDPGLRWLRFDGDGCP